jgi:hypothetical protein
MRRGSAAAPRTLSHAQPQKKQARTRRGGAGSALPSHPHPHPPPGPVRAPPSEPSELSEGVAQTGVLFRKMKNTPFS